MDEIKSIIFNVCNDMDLDRETTVKLKNVLYMRLNGYSIVAQSTDLVVSNDDTNRLINLYLDSRLTEGLSPKTIKQYEYNLKKFFLYIYKDVNKVTSMDIRAYQAYEREKRHVSMVTINNKLATLKAFFNWLACESVIPKDPTIPINLAKLPKKVKKPYSDSDIEKLMFAAKSKRDRAIIQLLLSTGCRVDEIVKINREEVNFDSKSIIVMGKGSKERPVHMNEKCIFYLREYLASRTDTQPALFISQRSTRFGTRGIETMLHTLGDRAGVKNVHPHRFRRTMATNLLNRGMELASVQNLLGHDSPTTTLMYAQIRADNVKADFNKYAN